MKKIIWVAAFMLGTQAIHAQVTDTTLNLPAPPPPRQTNDNGRNSIDIANRGNDHLMLQFGGDSWGSVPDSVKPSGFSRHFNVYFLLDRPFKTNPKFSVAFGAGIGSSNIFFDRTYVDITSNEPRLPFINQDSSDHFKKFKLTTVYAEAPVELRFSANPATPGRSFKVAVGAKVGMLISAHTKGKNLENRNGQTINSFIEKQKSKNYINSTRLSATARVGYGIFSLHGTYQINNFLKEGAGPEIRPFSIGLTISGL